MPLNDSTVSLTDKEFYFDDPFPTYREMRTSAPVYWHAGAECWVLTRYQDIEAVSKNAQTYSVGSGLLLSDLLKKHDYLSRMFPDGVETVSLADPPRHTLLRRVMNWAFARSRVDSFAPTVRDLTARCLDAVAAKGEAEVVHEVSVPVTAGVVRAFIDCEDMTIDQVLQWSDAVFRMGSDISLDEMQKTVASIQPMFEYFIAKAEERRANPKDDFIGHLVSYELDGATLSSLMVETYLQTVMVAGNETTRNAFTATIRLFAEHPEQYQRLRDNPDLVNSAVEEILRFHSPVLGFVRTATEDTQLGETRIARGEHVYMLYGAANRDPDVFEDPETFDIARFLDTQKTHLAFGRGPHICIGMAVARLELRTLLEELIARFSGFELLGKPERPDTLLGNGYTALNAKFHLG
ncbi:cytochrome P450 [Hyphomonas johnsonii]|uniref:Cytochrome P450 n=1 Tax=Hyphomonas johnsonii MHS-2 TaxID=1280950 RepID=A0A059FU30_9PROT|nr:cytochrome P450 [Hyphomonas johnsonii]KCZ94210.1 cytochrome P450 [Hyphomonas johnsonii MHS-2]